MNDAQTKIDISKLTAGVYMIRYLNKNSFGWGMFVKQ
jgi:hypothetical protein